MTKSVTLHSLITRVLVETDLADPREVAAKVAGMIDPDQREHILVNALADSVRSVMGQHRNAAMTRALARPNRSAKVAGIRDWWAEMCAARVHVGGSQWVALGDCGEQELAFAERERREDAAREIARADMFAELRELLRKHKVRTVAQLPRDVARGVAA